MSGQNLPPLAVGRIFPRPNPYTEKWNWVAKLPPGCASSITTCFLQVELTNVSRTPEILLTQGWHKLRIIYGLNREVGGNWQIIPHPFPLWSLQVKTVSSPVCQGNLTYVACGIYKIDVVLMQEGRLIVARRAMWAFFVGCGFIMNVYYCIVWCFGFQEARNNTKFPTSGNRRITNRHSSSCLQLELLDLGLFLIRVEAKWFTLQSQRLRKTIILANI